MTKLSIVPKMVMMLKRYLSEAIKNLALKNYKMAFISGPRQAGKTTLSKLLIKKKQAYKYYNWDEPLFRRQWVKDPKLLIKDQNIVIFDEIHKAKNWKRNLKGIFDTLEKRCQIIVTGSARLNIYKKGGDSLMGRYFNFRLHPLSVGELIKNKPLDPETTLEHIFSNNKKTENEDILNRLLTFGGFPEPYLKHTKTFLNLWQKGRAEKIVREDLRDLTRISELSQVELLMALLPERASKPLSIQSLREDLEVSYDTVQRYIKYLKELYYIFEIKPFFKLIPRAIKKEGKLYLWDWSEVPSDGERFENLVASHFLKACDYWTDSGFGNFSLSYLRDKQKNEIDFLILKNKTPWLAIECKSGKEKLSQNFKIFLPKIKCKYAMQLINKTNVWNKFNVDDTNVIIGSASNILSYFP